MTSTETHRRNDILLLLALTVAIYIRMLGHQFQMSWDDNWYIVYNESIQGFSWKNIVTVFSSIYQANYAPLQMLSYMLDHALWGLNPGGFAITNIMFHALNGLLVYRLLERLYGERLLALVGAAFFIAHPLQVESVAWLSCRKNVLSIFFFLLSWEAYRRYRNAEPGRGGGQYVWSVAAFMLSLMAKSTTLVLPAILLLDDFCFGGGKRAVRLKDKIPYIVAALVFAAVSMHFQHTDYQGGIRMPYHGGSPLATLYTMLPVFCLYLWRLVWPTGLSAIYDPAIHTAPDAVVVGAALALAALTWGSVRLFRFDRKLGFWFPFFWIGLLPFAQIVPILWLITDRYMNLSIIAPAALAGAGALWLRNCVGARGVRIVPICLVLWMGALAAVSFQRVGVWRTSISLWTDAAAKEPQSPRVWEHYGEALRTSGRLEEARTAYERVLAVEPENTGMLAGLGELYTETGQLDKGLQLLKKLLEIRPDYVVGWANLGTNYLKRGNFPEAEKAYRRAEVLQPEAWQVQVLLGDLARVQKRVDDARAHYLRAEGKAGWNAELAYHLACVEAMAGRSDAALSWLEKALQRGFKNDAKLGEDRQLSSLWNDPRFNYLLQRYLP